jgi:hypothetical protein
VRPDRWATRRAFARPTVVLVRVSSKGFLLGQDRVAELHGRITQQRLLRKLFQDGDLACDSTDGIRARNGTLCDECRHPQCRPWLRIHLARDDRLYVVDLAVTSAQNLLELENQAEAVGERLDDWTVKLTIRERGNWGEVCFQKL